MSDPWTENDTGKEWSDGTTWRYHRKDPNDDQDHAVLSASFFDGTHFKYDVTVSLFQQFFKDGAMVQYDAVAHAYSIKLPDGATYSVTLNGATLAIDATGKISLTSPVDIEQTAGGDIKTKTDTFDTSIDKIGVAHNSHKHGDPDEGDTTPPDSNLIT
jgi:phage baseplate assembly protein gpV